MALPQILIFLDIPSEKYYSGSVLTFSFHFLKKLVTFINQVNLLRIAKIDSLITDAQLSASFTSVSLSLCVI